VQQKHEYAILGGLKRTAVGRGLTQTAAAVSGVATFLVLQLVDLAKKFGLDANLPPIVLSLLGAGTVYAGLYWLFDNHLWRFGLVLRFLKVPDLSGEWACVGQTLTEAGQIKFDWTGKVRIVQTYDSIQVRLTTDQSASSSVAAALQCDDAGGYRLLYHYQNDPRVGEPELHGHRGFADITITEDGRAAEGEYFTGAGRNTFGRMTWTKEG